MDDFRHAISLDEHRVRFKPGFWTRPTEAHKNCGVKSHHMPRSIWGHLPSQPKLEILGSPDSLDISPHALTSAIEDTSPPLQTPHTPTGNLSRWTSGMENSRSTTQLSSMQNVATEVIAHLLEAILADFVPMVTGAYHSLLLLVTTPSYGFNARFSPPGLTNTTTGFPLRNN
ncbi:hypothetical protein C8R48DRAFT_768716 [Suillus tomentosus]|nr:hypothetical protein C8R48DRAFT_768716 [Suillus tomentosus]